MTKKRVYLDHSATTPLSPQALKAMQPYLKEIYGNPSSIHTFGQEAKKGLEDAREKISRLLNASKPEEIIFTGCGSESNNLAVKGVARTNCNKGRHIITSQIEHHAILYPCQFLEKQGFEVTYLPVDSDGRVNPEDVKKAINPGTILVTVMHANNEVGTIQPIKEIGEIIRQENRKRFDLGAEKIYFHTDAVQTAGKLKINVGELGVDLLSISAHKFYGPKGVGALYVKSGTAIEPLFHGGHHERNIRAGTENVSGIAGMAKALESAVSGMKKEQERLSALRQKLKEGIEKNIQAVKINGHPNERLAGILSVCFEFVEGESLLLSLDLEGIAVSTGSACASGSTEPSHVLKAMNVEPAAAQGTLRFSLGHQNSEEDIHYVLNILPKVVMRLRNMSPLWKQHKKHATSEKIVTT